MDSIDIVVVSLDTNDSQLDDRITEGPKKVVKTTT